VSEPYKRNPNTNCTICKKAIYRRPSQIKATKGKIYCSLTCNGISCRKEKPCLICGKIILAGLNKKTCSRSCANKSREGIRYKIGRPRDKAELFRNLKLKLLKKKGKKCGRCTYNKYEILQVHHKDRNRKNNKLDNLELICPNCHYEEHFYKKSWLKNKIEKDGK
jgi:hypothetical protein